MRSALEDPGAFFERARQQRPHMIEAPPTVECASKLWKILGRFGKAGKLLKEFGSIHEIDCRNPDQIYVGEITNWRVQKLTLHAAK